MYSQLLTRCIQFRHLRYKMDVQSDVAYTSAALPADEPSVSKPVSTPHHQPTSQRESSDETNTTTAERLIRQLARTSLIASKPALVSDHFSALPGDEASSASTQHQSLQISKTDTSSFTAVSPLGQRGPGTLLREDLLGSRGNVSSRSFLGARLSLPGVFRGEGGNGGGDISEESQHCPYVRMSGETPEQSPRRALGGEEECGVRATSSTVHPTQRGTSRGHLGVSAKSAGSYSGPAPSSRASLVGRLGSAFKLLATGGTAVNARGAGGGGSSGALREGRPGPSGTKYTQHAGSYSPFEPPGNQQLRKSLSAEPAFTAAAVVAASENGDAVYAPDDVRCNGGENDRQHGNCTSDAALTTEGGDEGGEGREQRKGEEEKALSESEGAPTGDATENSEAGAEAGAGSAFPERDSVNVGAVEGSAGRRPPCRETTGAAEGGGVDGQVAVKKPGLWELKAELSRIVQALSEAEDERDWEKLRAEEAAARLGEAVSRLEALGGNGLAGASIGVKG